MSTKYQQLMQAWWLCLIAVVGYCMYSWFRPWIRAVILALQLPGPSALPIIGNILIIKENTGLLKETGAAYAKYGPIVRGWISLIPIIVVLEPKHLQVILGSAKFTDKNFLYSLMHTFIGEGLITNNGYKWKSHRKYIQPYFHINILEMFIPTFSECSKALVERLRDVNEIKITSAINHCVLDILHQAILGIPVDDHNTKKKSPFSKGHLTVPERVLKPWLLLDFAYNLTRDAKNDIEQKTTLHEFTAKVLEDTKRRKNNVKNSSWCFLESLLEISETNPDFVDEDIVNETCTFMLAGQDSVGAAVSFTLYYLAKHQDVQAKVIEELNGVFLQSDAISMASLNEMKYLEQCIKEAMRLCPSVPLIARSLSEDIKLGDHVLPAGCNVFISPFATHRLPHYYPDPEKYDPDRFSTINQEKRNPYAYLPFSVGPRNCIGYKFAILEMKTIVSTLLRSYQIHLIPGHLEVIPTFRITLRAKGGIWLRLEPRKIVM